MHVLATIQYTCQSVTDTTQTDTYLSSRGSVRYISLGVPITYTGSPNRYICICYRHLWFKLIHLYV